MPPMLPGPSRVPPLAPPPPLGVVIDGSRKVLINGLPACRPGDTILEAAGGGDPIAVALPRVITATVQAPATFKMNEEEDQCPC